MGFNTPSKIQETALPTLLADPPQNMIAQSQAIYPCSSVCPYTRLGLGNYKIYKVCITRADSTDSGASILQRAATPINSHKVPKTVTPFILWIEYNI